MSTRGAAVEASAAASAPHDATLRSALMGMVGNLRVHPRLYRSAEAQAAAAAAAAVAAAAVATEPGTQAGNSASAGAAGAAASATASAEMPAGAARPVMAHVLVQSVDVDDAVHGAGRAGVTTATTTATAAAAATATAAASAAASSALPSKAATAAEAGSAPAASAQAGGAQQSPSAQAATAAASADVTASIAEFDVAALGSAKDAEQEMPVLDLAEILNPAELANMVAMVQREQADNKQLAEQMAEEELHEITGDDLLVYELAMHAAWYPVNEAWLEPEGGSRASSGPARGLLVRSEEYGGTVRVQAVGHGSSQKPGTSASPTRGSASVRELGAAGSAATSAAGAQETEKKEKKRGAIGKAAKAIGEAFSSLLSDLKGSVRNVSHDVVLGVTDVAGGIRDYAIDTRDVVGLVARKIGGGVVSLAGGVQKLLVGEEAKSLAYMMTCKRVRMCLESQAPSIDNALEDTVFRRALSLFERRLLTGTTSSKTVEKLPVDQYVSTFLQILHDVIDDEVRAESVARADFTSKNVLLDALSAAGMGAIGGGGGSSGGRAGSSKRTGAPSSGAVRAPDAVPDQPVLPFFREVELRARRQKVVERVMLEFVDVVTGAKDRVDINQGAANINLTEASSELLARALHVPPKQHMLMCDRLRALQGNRVLRKLMDARLLALHDHPVLKADSFASEDAYRAWQASEDHAVQAILAGVGAQLIGAGPQLVLRVVGLRVPESVKVSKERNLNVVVRSGDFSWTHATTPIKSLARYFPQCSVPSGTGPLVEITLSVDGTRLGRVYVNIDKMTANDMETKYHVVTGGAPDLQVKLQLTAMSTPPAPSIESGFRMFGLLARKLVEHELLSTADRQAAHALSRSAQFLLKQYALRFGLPERWAHIKIMEAMCSLIPRSSLGLLSQLRISYNDLEHVPKLGVAAEDAAFALVKDLLVQQLSARVLRYRGEFPRNTPRGALLRTLELLVRALTDRSDGQTAYLTLMRTLDHSMELSFDLMLLKAAAATDRVADERYEPADLAVLCNKLASAMYEDILVFDHSFPLDVYVFRVSARMFQEKLRVVLDRCLDDERVLEGKSADVLALYFRVVDLQKRFADLLSPSAVCDLLAPFERFLMQYFRMVNRKLVEWTQRATQVDPMTPVAGALHSSSAHDIFSLVHESIQLMVDFEFKCRADAPTGMTIEAAVGVLGEGVGAVSLEYTKLMEAMCLADASARWPKTAAMCLNNLHTARRNSLQLRERLGELAPRMQLAASEQDGFDRALVVYAQSIGRIIDALFERRLNSVVDPLVRTALVQTPGAEVSSTPAQLAAPGPAGAPAPAPAPTLAKSAPGPASGSGAAASATPAARAMQPEQRRESVLKLLDALLDVLDGLLGDTRAACERRVFSTLLLHLWHYVAERVKLCLVDLAITSSQAVLTDACSRVPLWLPVLHDFFNAGGQGLADVVLTQTESSLSVFVVELTAMHSRVPTARIAAIRQQALQAISEASDAVTPLAAATTSGSSNSLAVPASPAAPQLSPRSRSDPVVAVRLDLTEQILRRRADRNDSAAAHALKLSAAELLAEQLKLRVKGADSIGPLTKAIRMFMAFGGVRVGKQ